MLRSGQRGDSFVSFLVALALVVCSLYWLLSDYFPARAVDLQEVVALAGQNPAANVVLAASLKETPNPNRMELRRIRSHVNEVIVTEMARIVTGDKTIETPSERQANREREAVARTAALESKSFGEMSNEERAELVVSKWPIVLFGLVGISLALSGWRTIFRVN